MSRGSRTFRQRDVKAAIKTAEEAGKQVTAMRINLQGEIEGREPGARAAPGSIKTGTARPPWRYDAAIPHALQSANQRRPAILHYASSAAVSPISQGGPGYPSIAVLSLNPGIDAMCQTLHFALREKQQPFSRDDASLSLKLSAVVGRIIDRLACPRC